MCSLSRSLQNTELSHSMFSGQKSSKCWTLRAHVLSFLKIPNSYIDRLMFSGRKSSKKNIWTADVLFIQMSSKLQGFVPCTLCTNELKYLKKLLMLFLSQRVQNQWMKNLCSLSRRPQNHRLASLVPSASSSKVRRSC